MRFIVSMDGVFSTAFVGAQQIETAADDDGAKPAVQGVVVRAKTTGSQRDQCPHVALLGDVCGVGVVSDKSKRQPNRGCPCGVHPCVERIILHGHAGGVVRP